MQLTDTQLGTLERIANSAAGAHATVVGWALGGPVLKIKNRLAVITPESHGLETIAELEAR